MLRGPDLHGLGKGDVAAFGRGLRSARHRERPTLPDMGGRLGALAAAGVDRMLGDDQVASTDVDHLVAGIDTDTGADPARGHRVVVGLVAHEGLDGHGARGAVGHLIGVELGGGGEGLRGESITGTRLRGAVHAHVGHVAEPVAALGVEIIEAVEGAAVQKAVAQVGDTAFDLALGEGAVGSV